MSSLSTPTLRKLLREHIVGEPAGPVSDAEANAVGDALATRLAALPGVEVHNNTIRGGSGRSVREVRLSNSHWDYYGGASLNLHRAEGSGSSTTPRVCTGSIRKPGVGDWLRR